MRVQILIALLFLFNHAFGQKGKGLIYQIDSLARIADSSQQFQVAFLDGVISKTTELHSFKMDKSKKGNYTAKYYLDSVSKKLIKVEEAESIIYKSTGVSSLKIAIYYFNNDDLILVRTTEFQKDSKDNTVLSGIYYYSGRNLLYKQESLRQIYFHPNYSELSKRFISEAKRLFGL